MKCGDRPGTLTIVTYACVLLVLWGAPLPAAVAAPPPGVDIPAILKKSREYQLRFRDGDMEVVTANVDLLEKATAVEADNADLWYALGAAYVYVATRATLPGGNRADAVIALQKGMPALNRALQMNPDHGEAL